MSVIKIGGTGIHVQQLNESAAESILMIHGLGYGSLAVWYFKIAPSLSKKYRIVMYDHKSHGLSERAQTGYDLDTMTDDVAFLMNELNIKKTSFVGFSYGSLVALHFAIRFPERVNKLVLIEAPDPGDKNPEAVEYAKSNRIQINDDLRNLLFPEHVLDISGRKGRHVKKQNDAFEFLINESTLIEDIYNLTPFEKWETDKVIHETLAIYGNTSVCKPMADKLLSNIKNSKVKYFDGDHAVLAQYTSLISEELEDFFCVE